VSLTASGCNATPSPSRATAPTRQQSTSRIHNGNEARLPGHLAKGTLRQLGTPDERCPGKSAESYPLGMVLELAPARGAPRFPVGANPSPEDCDFRVPLAAGCPSPPKPARSQPTTILSRTPRTRRHPALSKMVVDQEDFSEALVAEIGKHCPARAGVEDMHQVPTVWPSVRNRCLWPSGGKRGLSSVGLRPVLPATRVPTPTRCPS
jgi:hypothetical protein